MADNLDKYYVIFLKEKDFTYIKSQAVTNRLAAKLKPICQEFRVENDEFVVIKTKASLETISKIVSSENCSAQLLGDKSGIGIKISEKN